MCPHIQGNMLHDPMAISVFNPRSLTKNTNNFPNESNDASSVFTTKRQISSFDLNPNFSFCWKFDWAYEMTDCCLCLFISYWQQKTETNDAILKKVAASDAVSDANKDAPVESLIKHPLQNSWTLWYYDQEKGKTWEQCQHQITTFDTVEDFWSLYNHIKLPTEIKSGNDYSLFKNNIRPMWEDEQNKNGGRWVISLQKFYRHTELDKLWLEVILCLIGEAFDYSEDICGAVVNVRQNRHKIG